MCVRELSRQYEKGFNVVSTEFVFVCMCERMCL